jgi:uncharacterized Fe-S cluster protein YjdI
MSKPSRTYTNGEITVEWRPEKCVHCEQCVTNLPEVFKPTQRPWVNMEASTTDKICDTVALCPDGALSIKGESSE